MIAGWWSNRCAQTLGACNVWKKVQNMNTANDRQYTRWWWCSIHTHTKPSHFPPKICKSIICPSIRWQWALLGAKPSKCFSTILWQRVTFGIKGGVSVAFTLDALPLLPRTAWFWRRVVIRYNCKGWRMECRLAKRSGSKDEVSRVYKRLNWSNYTYVQNLRKRSTVTHDLYSIAF